MRGAAARVPRAGERKFLRQEENFAGGAIQLFSL
jgi:hypothetical protein